MYWWGALVLSVITVQGIGQNLVPNAGFEDYARCPRLHSTRPSDFLANHWHSPSKGTPDYYHSCSEGESGVPINWSGRAEAHSGDAYAGIYLWTASNKYAEYLQCQLIEPLEKGVTYKIKFFFRFSSFSVYTINRITCLVTDLRLNVKNDQPIPINATYEQNFPLENATSEWQEVQFDYRADGGEQFIVLGNFVGESPVEYERKEENLGLSLMLSAAAYCYFDDVSVAISDVQLPPPTPPPAYFEAKKVQPGVVYRLRYVYFDFDSYVLKPEAGSELCEIVDILHEHEGWKVELSGHTDDVGSNFYNKMLSESRARSVALFVATSGIDEHRIFVRGYGKDKPLVYGYTEAARTKNRRVEIRFIGQ